MLLAGCGGTPPAPPNATPEPAVALAGDVTVRASAMPTSRLNPVMAHARGATVLGAEIKIAPPQQRKDPGRRAMS